jgi:hypothetical protein
LLQVAGELMPVLDARFQRAAQALKAVAVATRLELAVQAPAHVSPNVDVATARAAGLDTLPGGAL